MADNTSNPNGLDSSQTYTVGQSKTVMNYTAAAEPGSSDLADSKPNRPL